MSTRLERSSTNRVVAGVCGGLGEYLDIDATLVRAFFVVIGLGGVGIVAYLALIFLMPLPGRAAPFGGSASSVTPSGTTAEPGAAIATGAIDVTDRRRTTVGIFLVAIGVIFLMGNLGLFRLLDFRFVWPLVVIGFGLLLLVQRARR